jgi:hypothetical protein
VIELVTTVADAAERERLKTNLDRAADARREAIRQAIRDALTSLRAQLGHFEQTTHGSGYYHGATIENVAAALIEAWNRPTSFTVSELDQVIGGFLKTHGGR